MPFIGNQPALSYTSFAKQDFTTSATTSYVLDQPVTNENEIALFINFVRQEPTTAYTASGTSLTLTSATSASDDMYAIFLGKAVQTVNPPAGSVGASQITDGSIALGKLSATGTKDSTTFLRGDNTFNTPPLGGITEADQWRITADVTNSGPTNITANWERNDTDFAYLGTGMTESSGIFTFPSTGIWLIIVTINYVLNVTSSYVGGYGSVTTNNSTYTNRLQLMNTPANGHFGSIHGDFIFDVTDVTTHKFKLISESGGSINVQGGTDRQRTGVTFIRLGDT